MRAAWALLVLLGACTTPRPSGDDVTVLWTRVDDPHAVCSKLSGQAQLFAVRGCAKWNATDSAGKRVCSIYAPMPRSEMDTQRFVTLGHELMHCFDGNWHDRWGRMNPAESQAAAGSASEGFGSHDEELPRPDVRVGAVQREGEVDVQDVAE
jgi:hypothetical protein